MGAAFLGQFARLEELCIIHFSSVTMENDQSMQLKFLGDWKIKCSHAREMFIGCYSGEGIYWRNNWTLYENIWTLESFSNYGLSN